MAMRVSYSPEPKRKNFRSYTSPNERSSLSPEVESPHDLRTLIDPPPGLDDYDFSSPFELKLTPADGLLSKIQDYEKLNEELTQEITHLRGTRKTMGLEEILALLCGTQCTECERVRAQESKELRKMKENHATVLSSFHELYKDYKTLVKKNAAGEPYKGREALELKETLRILKIRHSEEICALLQENEKEKEVLRTEMNRSFQTAHGRLALYEAALRNVKVAVAEKLPDFALEISLSECSGCLSKQATIDQLQNPNELKVLDKYVYPPSKYVLRLSKLVLELEVLANSQEPETVKKFKLLKATIEEIKREKPQQLKSARTVRSQIHKQVVDIEKGFELLASAPDEVLALKKQFLELPFLLKPLFELSKGYESEVPVLVVEPASTENSVYKFLCRVASASEGILKVEDIQMVLANYQKLLNEVKRYETILGK